MNDSFEEIISKISIDIPEYILEDKSGFSINYDLINEKNIIGLLGYAGCGKDTVANFLSESYNYKKIKFGDPLKELLNNQFKEKISQDINNNNLLNEYVSPEQIDFFEESNREIKDVLRPYMVWLGEKIREMNGPYYWINRAFENLYEEDKNIVIADIRRPDELDLFENNNSQKRKYIDNLIKSGFNDENIFEEIMQNFNEFETKLFYVNQYNLKDKDELTVRTILDAFERWLVNDTIYIDSRIPEENRSQYIKSEINDKL